MNASLISHIPRSYESIHDFKKFFDDSDHLILKGLEPLQAKELRDLPLGGSEIRCDVWWMYSYSICKQ